jgi:hypothetical protein
MAWAPVTLLGPKLATPVQGDPPTLRIFSLSG